MTKFYVVRHGESEYNIRRLIQGSGTGENRLTEKGKKQAKELAALLKDISIDLLYSSHIKRAFETAEIIGKEHALPVNIDERLRERSQGTYEDMPVDEFNKLYTEKNWAVLSEEEKFNHKLNPSQESFTESNNRFTEVLLELAKKNPNKTILIVTHGGIIRGLLIKHKFGNFKQIGGIENCGYVKISSDGNTFTVEDIVGLKTWDEKYPTELSSRRK